MTVSAVIVNYNAGDHLLDCVKSLQAEGVKDIVVVDNASSDGSVARLRETQPDVRVHYSAVNLGYGGGANRGIAEVDSGYVLVINPDAVVHDGAVEVLAGVLDNDARVGIVGPRIDEVDGSVYPSARAFPRLRDAIGHAFIGLVTTNNPYSRRYLMTDTDVGTARDTDWISGACFLARRVALADVDGFDESYFMYLEEVDLCRRAGRAGWIVRYEPAARVTHVQGVSTAQHPYRMLAAHHRSLLRYWWRNASGLGRLLAPVVVLGLALRLVVMCARRALDPTSAK